MKEDGLLLVLAIVGYLFFTNFYTLAPADLRVCQVYGPTPDGVTRCLEWRDENAE
jgi:hypothetical protein